MTDAAAPPATLVPTAGLETRRDAWMRLFLAAPSGSPFYGPDFMVPHRALSAGAGFLVADAPDGVDIDALLPLTRHFSVNLPFTSLENLTGAFIVDGAPLLRAGSEETGWLRLLDGARGLAPRGLLRLAQMPLQGPCWEGLESAARASGRAIAIVTRRERAELVAGSALRAKAKTQRDIRRCLRRLGETGNVVIESIVDEAAATQARDTFLHLEASGWKGRSRTALACTAATLRFATAALSPDAGAPRVRFDQLSLDGRTIAAAIHLVGPGGAIAFKCAYDETYARFSPGLILDQFAADALAGSQPWTRRLDSGAMTGHPVEGLWPDRKSIGLVLVALSPGLSQDSLERRAAREASIGQIKDALKKRLKRLLRR